MSFRSAVMTKMWVLFVPIVALGQSGPAESARLGPLPERAARKVYKLDETSTYQNGCFPPCLCPLLETAGARGTFTFTRTGFDGLYTHYDVTNINWIVSLGAPELRVTGSGTYQVGGEFALLQRLELDLVVGDEPPEHFDSDWVAVGAGLPALDLTISINGIWCQDTVFVVQAAPVPPDEIQPYRLRPGSTFQRGCWDPCDCILEPERPMVGRLGLVRLQETPLFTEYAVVNAAWFVRVPTDPPERIRIRGTGTYWVGGEFAVKHQLSMDLTVGEEPLTHFDSGLIIGGHEFPRLDALISINGVFCYDTVLKIIADPRHP